MEKQNEGFLCYPLQFHLPVRLSGEHLAKLSMGAALWGRRHGLLTFEELVSCCCSNWREGRDSLEPLAGLTKDEYSEKGTQLLRQLEIETLCDTEEAHQQYADEVIARVFDSVLSQRDLFPVVAERVINSIAAEIDCVCEMEWTGDPETPPYLNDHGFSPTWTSTIFQARYLLQQATSFSTRLKFRFSREECLDKAWEKIEKMVYYNLAAESNLPLSSVDRESLIKSIEKEFPLGRRPRQLVPEDFVDCCGDVAFLALYKNWKDIPYYEFWYERACMTYLLPQGLLYILPAILHTMVKGAYSREVTHRLINAIASKAEKSMTVTKNQYQLIERVLFLPEEDIALRAENGFNKEDCFGNSIIEQISKARQVFKVR